MGWVWKLFKGSASGYYYCVSKVVGDALGLLAYICINGILAISVQEVWLTQKSIYKH